MLEECNSFVLISQGNPGPFRVDVEPRSLEVVRGGDCRHYRADQVKLIFECMSRHFILIGAVGPSPLDGEPAISDMDSSFGCHIRRQMEHRGWEHYRI